MTIESSRLEVLAKRFLAMAEVREKHSGLMRYNPDISYSVIAGLESAALAYRRCAEEVRKVADGEIPPPPHERWDE